MDIIVEKINLTNPIEVIEVSEFLDSFNLSFERGIDYSVVARRGEEIVGTCSKEGNILKCFAVSEAVQGEGLTNKMIKNLQDKLFKEGYYHSFIFTKPEYVKTFGTLGYNEVERSEKVVLLEGGFGGIEKALEKMKETFGINGEKPKTALVMNCNPFTLGHRYLVEEASKRSDEVLLFVVEEDRSLFPFDVRYELIKKGVSDLKNVKVVPGGSYIISSATFPVYFLKGETEQLNEYTTLDAKIFGRYFCKKFNINRRILGEEPYCKVTQNYNETLIEILGKYKVGVEIIGRSEDGGGPISASRVRESIRRNKGLKLEELKDLLPETTLDYLFSDEGKKVIQKIIHTDSRH